MIGSLKGTVEEILSDHEILFEVGGVGYRVTVLSGFLTQTPNQSVIKLHIHTRIKDEGIILYGFADVVQRKTFELLLSTHGVGPGLAMSILNVHSPSSLEKIISTKDIDALNIVPGLGKRTSSRLLLELGNKLGNLDVVPIYNSNKDDLHQALVELGYLNEEISRVLVQIFEDSSSEQSSIEELLRSALRRLAKK